MLQNMLKFISLSSVAKLTAVNRAIDPHLLRLSAYYKVYLLNYYIGKLNNVNAYAFYLF